MTESTIHVDLFQGREDTPPSGSPLCGAVDGAPVDTDLEYNSAATCEACFTVWDLRNDLETSWQ